MSMLKSFAMSLKNPCVSSFVDGKIIRIESIPDQAFSHKMIGDGLAIQTSSQDIYAPCDGVISVIASTGHAFIICRDDGAEVLIHIGINKTKPNPDCYKYHVNLGQRVNQNTLIVSFSKEIMDTNHEIIIPVMLLNHKQHPIRTLTTAAYITRGKKLFTYK